MNVSILVPERPLILHKVENYLRYASDLPYHPIPINIIKLVLRLVILKVDNKVPHHMDLKLPWGNVGFLYLTIGLLKPIDINIDQL